jgi:hypothetical protein
LKELNERHDLAKRKKTLIRIDRTTLFPKDAVPKKKRHRLLFALALLHLGKYRQDPSRVSLAALTSHLEAVCAGFFANEVYRDTLDRAASAAIEVERRGANNLYRGQPANGDYEARI